MRHRTRASAFTLVEVLVVVVIIALLAAIGMYVGRTVAEGGKRRVTENNLQVLDQILTAYQKERKGAATPAVFKDGAGYEYPMFDGRLNASGNFTADPNPSLSLFLAAALRDAPETDALLAKVDPKFLERTDSIQSLWGTPVVAAGGQTIRGVIVRDGWGRPIRFVHPEQQGAWGDGYVKDVSQANSASAMVLRSSPRYIWSGTLNPAAAAVEGRRRAFPFDPNARPGGATGDADEGKSTSPYFYSMGPDGDAGTRDDNIYSKKPTFDGETRPNNNS